MAPVLSTKLRHFIIVWLTPQAQNDAFWAQMPYLTLFFRQHKKGWGNKCKIQIYWALASSA
jgi:hypothetical protein